MSAPAPNRQQFGLRTKIAGLVVGSMVLLFVPTAVLSEHSLRGVMLKEFSSQGESIAIAIANATEGYIAEDRDASTIQGFVDRFRHLEGVGYVFVLDNTGDAVAHTFAPEFPDVMKTAHPFVGEQDEQHLFDEKELDVPGHGPHKDIVVPLLQGRQGEVHVGMSLAVVNKQVAEATATLVFASLLAFVLAIGVVLWLADRLVRPVRLLSVVARRIADEGDLTQALPLASTGDEVEVLTQAFAGMVQRLKTIPLSLGDSVAKLSQVVETLTAMTTQQAQQLSRQAAAVQQTSVTVREIEETSKLASGKAVSVVEVAARAESLGQSGQRSLNETLARLEEIQEQVQSVMGRVEALSERTGQVGEITETVKELATQSKVLALNAAIEAVKAGEQGKGFSVVAREIRGLAAESLASTERVRGILSEVQESIVAVVSGSRSGAGRIQQSTEQVRSGGEDIQKLANVVEENASAARQIAAAVSQQDAGIKQIAVAIGDLNQMLTESARALQETNDVAQELKMVALGVSEVVKRFRV